MTRVACGAIIACLAACGFRSTPQTVDGNGGEPDIDATIDAPIDATIDAPIDTGIADIDHDGVADVDDNCMMVANADQHDEDGDLVGDPCDPCPQVANATTDTDGDLVPDACDPHPDKRGDVLVKFETFAGTGNLPPGWLSKGGGQPADWTRADDAMTIAADNNTPIVIFDTGSPRHALDVGIEVTDLTGIGLQFLTVLADASSDIRQYFSCGMRFDNLFGGKSRELLQFDAQRIPQFNGLSTDFTDAPARGAYRIQFVSDGDGQICVIPQGAAPHRQSSELASRDHTFIGLRANNITVSFRYVAIYRF